MEHGARIELRELPVQAHRGSESAAQVAAAPNGALTSPMVGTVYLSPQPGEAPFVRLGDMVAAGQPLLTLDPADARDLPGLADQVVTLAQQFAPRRCGSAAECFRLTRDVRESVQLMIDRLEQPERLDVAWVSPWMASPNATV